MGRGVARIQGGKITSFQWEAVPINLPPAPPPEGVSGPQLPVPGRIPEDRALLAQLIPYGEKVDQLLAEVIGQNERTLTMRNGPDADAPLGVLSADAVLWYVRDRGTDFAIVNRGAIRTDLPAGPIQRKIIYGMLPFDNTISVVRLRGRDLQRRFDFVGTRDPEDGGFPVVSDGVSFTLDTAAKRCTDIRVKGRPLDPDAYYTVATTSFLVGGGNGYVMFKDALERWDSSVFHRDALVDYIRSLGGTVRVAPTRRITFLPPLK
jgi:2',3'-cyclic-nucleotide 2'-phosphodiesterase (5'-nucleotidase family)